MFNPFKLPVFSHWFSPKHLAYKLACELILSRWDLESDAVEMTSVPVLLFKMRCMLFSTVKTCLCALSEESTLSFSSLSANSFPWSKQV